MNIKGTLMHHLRMEGGSASAAVIFVIVAVIIGGILATIALTVTSATSANTGITMMESAVTARTNSYLSDLATNPNPSTAEICYPATRSCVTVTAANADQITLQATYNGGDLMIDRTASTKSGVSHISGFDEWGDPVWAVVPGYAQFPAR